MAENNYELIIVGGGPAGLSAGIYASRARVRTLLIEKMGCGGQAAITDSIENYPGFPESISGFELTARMEAQARAFGTEIVHGDVAGIERMDDGSWKVTGSDVSYTAAAVIIASGAKFRMLGVPGEQEFVGRGVSYCATCDGAFFRGREVVVVGGGDSAVQEALFLTRFAAKVTVIHRRGQLRASAILRERVKANEKITLLMNTIVTSVNGEGMVTGVGIKNTVSGETGTYAADGVFIFVGWTPNTAFTGAVIARDEKGYIITDEHMATGLPGLFACGDARRKILRQVVTAAGDGATAAVAAQEYLSTMKNVK